MAGDKGAKITGIIDQQIEKVQIRVAKTKVAYDRAVEDLQKLLDKRDAYRKDKIWKAIIKSNKSYDEILHLISDDEEAECIESI